MTRCHYDHTANGGFRNLLSADCGDGEVVLVRVIYDDGIEKRYLVKRSKSINVEARIEIRQIQNFFFWKTSIHLSQCLFR